MPVQVLVARYALHGAESDSDSVRSDISETVCSVFQRRPGSGRRKAACPVRSPLDDFAGAAGHSDRRSNCNAVQPRPPAASSALQTLPYCPLTSFPAPAPSIAPDRAAQCILQLLTSERRVRENAPVRPPTPHSRPGSHSDYGGSSGGGARDYAPSRLGQLGLLEGSSPIVSAASPAPSGGGSAAPGGRRKPKQDLSGPCCHCGVISSPQWRKGPKGKPILCNACGIRFLRTRSLGKTMVRPRSPALGAPGRAPAMQPEAAAHWPHTTAAATAGPTCSRASAERRPPAPLGRHPTSSPPAARPSA